jgi:hypothetical protein
VNTIWSGAVHEAGLEYWKRLCITDYFEQNLKAGKKLTQKDIDSLLSNAKNSSGEIGGAAAKIGTFAHDVIDDICKKSIKNQKHTWEIEPVFQKLHGKEVRHCVKLWIAWAKKNTFVVKHSELTVYHDGYKYAGTLDAYGLVNGVWSVIDWKSGMLYNNQAAKTVAYKKAFDSMNNIKPGTPQVIIVRLPKDKKVAEMRIVKDEAPQFEAFVAAKYLFDYSKMKRTDVFYPAKRKTVYDTE